MFDPRTVTSWFCFFFPFVVVVIAVDIYSLKTISEWKCALEKSLNDAANFPLPMEVFKVKDFSPSLAEPAVNKYHAAFSGLC